MNFNEDIRLLLEDKNIDELRAKAWQKYGDFLFGSDINSAKDLTDFQIGFLNLLSDKYLRTIVPLITNNVKSEFDEWYEDRNSYGKIAINSIDIQSVESGKWQIMFEDDNMDLIVHLYMRQWEFDYTARTG
jgi:hypothetical protein